MTVEELSVTPVGLVIKWKAPLLFVTFKKLIFCEDVLFSMIFMFRLPTMQKIFFGLLSVRGN